MMFLFSKNRDSEYHDTNLLVVEADAYPEFSFKTDKPQSSKILGRGFMTLSGKMNSEYFSRLLESCSI
jgi:hypothetical protein